MFEKKERRKFFVPKLKKEFVFRVKKKKHMLNDTKLHKFSFIFLYSLK